MKNNDTARHFSTWDKTSSVRSRPYKYMLTREDTKETNPERWFPSVLIPELTKPLTDILPAHARLKIHIGYLLHFLDYTTDLEIMYVNRAVPCITVGSLARFFSAQDRLSALKLYTDEGYHALFSKELSDQILQYFAIPRRRSTRLNHLDRICHNHFGKHLDLVLFLIAFVSETIIVRELSWLSHDDLVAPIFHMFQDHLLDEAKHAIFFADAFVNLWGQLSTNEKSFAVTALISIIHAFFRPNTTLIRTLTQEHFLTVKKSLSTHPKNWKSRIIKTTTLTMKAVRRTDLLENHDYLEALRVGGLLE